MILRQAVVVRAEDRLRARRAEMAACFPETATAAEGGRGGCTGCAFGRVGFMAHTGRNGAAPMRL